MHRYECNIPIPPRDPQPFALCGQLRRGLRYLVEIQRFAGAGRQMRRPPPQFRHNGFAVIRPPAKLIGQPVSPADSCASKASSAAASAGTVSPARRDRDQPAARIGVTVPVAAGRAQNSAQATMTRRRFSKRSPRR